MTITIIGIGRLGGALALALSKKGYIIDNLVVRNAGTAEKIKPLIDPLPVILQTKDIGRISSDVILIATPDAEIETVAGELAERLTHRPVVLHTSGSLSSEILRKTEKKGCPAGSLHPLVSVSDPLLGAGRFAGAFFCVEGNPEAVKIAEKIATDLGGRSFFIKTAAKALYHAAAVVACGHLVALIDVAIGMLAECGLDKKDAQKILLPLIKSTVENLHQQTPAEALTGTFARADAETFERHLTSLDGLDSEEIRQVYLQLGERSLHLAETRNIDRKKLKKMRKRISLAKKNLKC